MASYYPRKNKDGEITSYLIRVYKGRDKDGNQLKPYTMTWKVPPNKTQRQIQKELYAVVYEFEKKCKEGLVSENPSLTFGEFVTTYKEITKNTLSPLTYDFYCRIIDRFLIPEFGHMKLTAIKPIHVQTFILKLTETTAKIKNNGIKEHSLSPATVQRYLTCLKSILRQAVKQDLISVNPADSHKLTMPKAVQPKVDIFSKQEAQQILSCLVNEELQFQVLIQLAIMTGARRGELVGLKFSDIDYQKNQVVFQRSAIKISGQPITTKPPKDYEVRTVTVNQFCIELIRQLKEEKEKDKERLGDKWVGDDWLFTQWNGEIMHPSTPTKWFSKFLKKYGLKHRKFHSLRHTSATLLLYGGLDIKQVQGRLGHGDIETTNRYLHYISEADTQAAIILDNMLSTKDNVIKIG